MKYRALYYTDGKIRLIDQTELPDLKWVEHTTHFDIYTAIKTMQVRGAPLIGIAAAYGMVLAAANVKSKNPSTWEEYFSLYRTNANLLKYARPTAVNLEWAVERVFSHVRDSVGVFDVDFAHQLALEEANRIMEEDRHSCAMIGKYGNELIRNGYNIMTYCNAGALATSELGTALAPIYIAHEEEKDIEVYCCETRPLFQGSRLTAWELMQAGIKPTLVCDNAIGQLMNDKKIDMVIVGADRIAANGDVANKIGTYGLAMLAAVHGIPFFVAAPTSTFDLRIKNGSNIQIEHRHTEEITKYRKESIAPADIRVYNPAFDITPGVLITGIITERGIVRNINSEEIRRVCIT